jgi:hypothetical protein
MGSLKSISDACTAEKSASATAMRVPVADGAEPTGLKIGKD